MINIEDKIIKAKKSSVRKQLFTYNNCKVIFIKDSKKKPEIKGNRSYYTNKSGDIINYPNAYRRKFGKPIYHASTYRIEVGDKYYFKLPKNIKRLAKLLLFS